ncbi:MAG: toll/interleukin-1 receptor domain-containing protein [Rhizobiaceae bacterium]|nr:toll/interleukin-1 receptor domain-containing protein [Rhizobiaceae bacterium]MBL4697038.1 toll/interleukin-1 receptor domain-containing protein [Rhizobiaceae bacterium]
MSHKIFLSHNFSDKPIVEAVAVKLTGIFGEDQVFYDSWSIKPGDGIIDQMNKGLEAPEFVFFFVSANSLDSGMVRLEWQNALYSASKGHTRIIPVRVDGTAMPPVLMQTLYIDMHTIGLDPAIAQIVSVTQGNASFTPQHQGFSNLSYSVLTEENGTKKIVVNASHLLEPNPHFLVLIGNSEGELTWKMGGSPFIGGFDPGYVLTDGSKHNGINMKPLSQALSPNYPLRIELKQTGTTTIDFRGILHQKSEHSWIPVPNIQ